MIVLTIMAVLVSIAVPMYQGALVKAREAALLEDLFQIRTAIDKYYADQNAYPESLDTLVEKKYIHAVPVDPFTDSKDSWVMEYSGDNSGIYDVHSGSEGVGRNGVAYSEW